MSKKKIAGASVVGALAGAKIGRAIGIVGVFGGIAATWPLAVVLGIVGGLSALAHNQRKEIKSLRQEHGNEQN